MIRGLALLFFWCSSSLASATPKYFDQSHEIFLTPQLASIASNFRDFPLFWWNFVVVDGEAEWNALEGLCARFASEEAGAIAKMPCHFELKQLGERTRDWTRDLPLRQAYPGDAKFRAALDETLGKASLPMGHALIDVLRADPLNSLLDLKERVEKRMRMDLQRKGGFFVDERAHRVLMPVQFAFPPSDSARTFALMHRLEAMCAGIKGCTSLMLFGPHGATAENETRIREDVDVVSWVGAAALGLLCLFLFFTGRQRVLNLVPILLFAIAGTAGVTILLFGKIHGITVAFGPGIVGLAMDYGIHSCFLGPSNKKTWRANWVGIWTTISIMIVLGFSAIPLLRQMMFFSVFGLCFSYLLFWIILRRWPKRFEAETYRFVPSRWAFLNPVSWLLIASCGLLAFQKVHLDIQHLNFESARTREVREWFAKVGAALTPYLVSEDSEHPLTSSTRYRDWSESHGMRYEGVASYLPDTDVQARNLSGWRERFCERPLALSESEQKFFQPFLAGFTCAKLVVNPLLVNVPDYLKDFHNGGRFVGLFFPQGADEAKALHEQYPQVSTPREVFDSFPRIFYGELLWMVPIAFAASFFFLYLHYREFSSSVLAVVPFITGLGLYALLAELLHLPVSFISLIGLLMVFGCSLDYGVFVMDFLLFRGDDKPGVWSALSLCAFATIAGFAPLVFARHPVLNDLGHALLWGTLGTYIGSLWGIPSVYQVFKRKAAI